jgi:hypothetical protein
MIYYDDVGIRKSEGELLEDGITANGWGDENTHIRGQFDQIKHFHFCSLFFYANGHI